MIFAVLKKIITPVFGFFNYDELKKFLTMGTIFSLILGAYWTLGTIKESLFTDLMGSAQLPYAKVLSLCALVPLLMIYSQLLDFFSRERLFVVLSIFYCIVTLIFAWIISYGTYSSYATYFLSYGFYAFVESYGSLLVALFWSISVDITQPDAAKKGFPLIVACGQIGGIIGPLLLCKIPRWCGHTTSGLAITISALLIMSSLALLIYFFYATPSYLLESYGTLETTEKKGPGFFEGLNLIVKSNYLICIVLIVFSFEFITQVLDFHFRNLAAEQYSGLALAEYFGVYGSLINFTTLLCLLLGINKITQFFGITASLIVLPAALGITLFGFMKFYTLSAVLSILILLKALNFALNIPTIKQLYIPTTHDIRFKAQAWIETFGSRTSRQFGGVYTMLLQPLELHFGAFGIKLSHIILTGYVGYSLVVVWFFMALYLGNRYNKAIKEQTVIS